MPDLRRLAAEHAVRLTEDLEGGLRDALATDALAMLDGWDHIVVSRTDEAVTLDRCSVAAGYHPGPPPRIFVARSASLRRAQFSALHEYAHHLIAADVILGRDVFPIFNDGGEHLEEVICDAFAAGILLPLELVEQYIGADGPTAQAVADLFYASGASREACCVRAAQRLPHAGHVMLAKGQKALFTATHNQPWRVQRHTDQGPNHLVVHAGRHGQSRRETRVRYGNGNESDLLWGDAVSAGDYVFAVFMANTAPWQSLSLFRGSPQPSGNTSVCKVCDWEFVVRGVRCGGCGGAKCPVHEVCWCDDHTVAERLCQECFTRRSLNQFQGETSTCNDCLT